MKEILIGNLNREKKNTPTQTPKDLSFNVPERQVLLYQVGAVMFAGVSQLVGLHSAMQRKKELTSPLQTSQHTTDHNSVIAQQASGRQTESLRSNGKDKNKNKNSKHSTYLSHCLRNKRGELLTNSSDSESGLIHKIHYNIVVRKTIKPTGGKV